MGIDFAPFLLISVLLILIPGPDTAIVTKHALLAGRRGGVFASVGVATGHCISTEIRNGLPGSVGCVLQRLERHR